MTDLDQLLDQQPAAIPPPSAPPPMPRPPRRKPLDESERATIRELSGRGESTSAIASKLDVPARTIRDALRAMRKPPAPPQRAKTQRFTQADRVRIWNLLRSGLSAAQIAVKLGRGVPQVSKLVKELDGAPPRSVALQVGDTKASLPTKTWDMVIAAAKRRSVEPAVLLAQICQGIVEHGSIDRAVHADANHIATDGRSLRVVQISIDFEALDRCGGLDQLEYQIPIKARLKSLRSAGP
jgi:hypothetical protein